MADDVVELVVAYWRILGAGDAAHLIRGERTLCGRRAPGVRTEWPEDRDAPRCLACSAVGPYRYTVAELLELGVTIRQVHHWTARGWLVAERARGHRVFDAAELGVARRAVALLAAGYRTARALELARASG